jgi:hypothetical protein
MRVGVVVIAVGLLVGALGSPSGRPGWAAAADTVAAPADTLRQDKQEDRRQAIKSEMARVAGPEVPAEKQWERQKSPTVAMVSSMVLPGLGQLYNGRRIKTAIAAGTFTYYLGKAWLEQKKSQEHLKARDELPRTTPEENALWNYEDELYQFYKESAKDYLWWSGAVWLITVLDAFVDAHLYDVRAVTPTVVSGAGGAKYLAFEVGF